MDGSYNGIILSGDPKAGKTTLVEKLKEIYPWEHHSFSALIREKHLEMHPDEEVPFEEFYRATELEDLRIMNKIVAERFAQGDVIGESRVAIYCEDHPLLLVYLTADLDIRAERSLRNSEYEGKTFEQIIDILKQRQKDEVQNIMELYNYDYRDARRYDLVLNTGRLGVDQEVDAITSLIPPS